jgi:hypothetical protein
MQAKIPSEAKVRRAIDETVEMRKRLEALYVELGGADLWRECSALLDEDKKTLELSEDEVSILFYIKRTMECLYTASENVGGVKTFLRDFLEKPHLHDLLWGGRQPFAPTARRRRKR